MTDIDHTLTEEALKIVNGDRQKAYDAPERNFHRIALAWEAITDRSYTAAEVGLMFVALKLVRESHQHQRDNFVDGIGYLLCAESVTEKLPSGRLAAIKAMKAQPTYAQVDGLVNCIDGCSTSCKQMDPQMHTPSYRAKLRTAQSSGPIDAGSRWHPLGDCKTPPCPWPGHATTRTPHQERTA